MRKRIHAVCLAFLLTVSLILSLPVSVKADLWDETIKHYDGVFAGIDGEPKMKLEELYSALLLDSETFLNQLAFRDQETKEYVCYILTGDWVRLDQLARMIDIVSAQDLNAVTSASEKSLLKALLFQLESAFYCRELPHQPFRSLFAEAPKHDVPTDSFCSELQLSVVQESRNFIIHLAQEDAEIQNLIISSLHLEPPYNTLRALVFQKLAQEYNRGIQQMDYFTDAEMELICQIVWDANLKPSAPVFSDPNSKELQQWLTETKPLEILLTFNYEKLFANMSLNNADSLVKALLLDTENFVNELAFRNVVIKHTVLSILTSKKISDVQLEQMRICLKMYRDRHDLTLSENQLLQAMVYQLEYCYYNRPHPHRDWKVLFAEATSEIPYDRLPDFCDELKLAFSANPRSFIILLAQENEAVQQSVMIYLWSASKGSKALPIIIASKWAGERANHMEAADYYTEEEFALLQNYSHLNTVVADWPALSEPDPDEYEQWLQQKYPHVYGPSVPTNPPTEPPAEDDTGENSGHQPQKDTGWIATVCFVLVSLCLGVATGLLIAKKKKAQQAAAQPQISPQLPVKTHPKLLYCPAPLERDVQQQITLALREKYDEYSMHWYSVKEPDGTCRCYGTENGYDILFYAGGFRLEIPDSCTVGEYIFHFATGFELYAHKGGTLTDLNAALEQGLVSPQAVQEALAKHKALTE